MYLEGNKLHRLLWDVSYMSLRDTLQVRRGVQELVVDSNASVGATKLQAASIHEEVQTANLVRRLSVRAKSLGIPLTVATHSKYVEGTGAGLGKVSPLPPSGADLQIAIAFPSGKWIDVLLQAKRLNVGPGGIGQYSGWNSGGTQNRALMNWAAARGMHCGMLLYNDVVDPFVAREPPRRRKPADWNCGAFPTCNGANHVYVKRHAQAAAEGKQQGDRLRLLEGTPMGVSVCWDQAMLLAKDCTPFGIATSHFPIEYLAHLPAGGGSSGTGGGTPNGDSPGGGRVTDDLGGGGVSGPSDTSQPTGHAGLGPKNSDESSGPMWPADKGFEIPLKDEAPDWTRHMESGELLAIIREREAFAATVSDVPPTAVSTFAVLDLR